MGGGPGHLAVMADIERALGRPERALDLARGPEARELDRAEAIELAIVAAGARRDLGELEAAVVGLQIAELDPAARDPWSARLFYAYADNLRRPDASGGPQWFMHAADADETARRTPVGRLAELTGEPFRTTTPPSRRTRSGATPWPRKRRPRSTTSPLSATARPTTQRWWTTSTTRPPWTQTRVETAADDVPGSAADPVVAEAVVPDADVVDAPDHEPDTPTDDDR